MLLNLRAMDNARAGNDPATTQPASIAILLPNRRTRGKSSPPPHRAAFDLTSGKLASIQATFDLDLPRVAPFSSESIEPKGMSGPGSFEAIKI